MTFDKHIRYDGEDSQQLDREVQKTGELYARACQKREAHDAGFFGRVAQKLSQRIEKAFRPS